MGEAEAREEQKTPVQGTKKQSFVEILDQVHNSEIIKDFSQSMTKQIGSSGIQNIS